MDPSILLTGASGYIGGRLLRSLEEGGHAVRCLARHPDKVVPTAPTTEVVAGDCLDEASLDRALAGVQCAYYLVHSLARQECLNIEALSRIGAAQLETALSFAAQVSALACMRAGADPPYARDVVPVGE